MRVIVIKRPNIAVQGMDLDHFLVGETYEMSSALALLMMAAGWVRAETRKSPRRRRAAFNLSFTERRHVIDRRVEASL